MLYLLSVGINTYKNERIPALKACLRDVERVVGYVKKFYPENEQKRLTLTNEEATYIKLVEAFRGHFQQAGPGDVVVFHFSGHGSRARSAPEFVAHNTDDFDECLVLHDSRTDGIPELADKELAILIDEVVKRGAQMVVVLDCCHAGSGTRDIGNFFPGRARHTWSNEAPRELSSYLGGYFLNRGLGIPDSPHALFSACTQYQKAWEGPGGKGLFTDTLIGELEKNQGNISYSRLFIEVQKAITKYPLDQTPQFEAYGSFNPQHRCFTLDNTSSELEGQLVAVYYDADSFPAAWYIDQGMLHGMPQDLAQPMRYLLYEKRGDKKSVGEAVLSRVYLNNSCLTLPAELAKQKGKIFYASVASSPIPPIRVKVEGTEGENWQSSYVELVSEEKQAQYILSSSEGNFSIQESNSKKRVLQQPMKVHNAEGLEFETEPIIQKRLGQIHRWHHLLNLQHAKTQFKEEDVSFQFFERKKGQEIPYVGNDLVLDFHSKDGKPVPVWLTLKATNHTDEPLYATLVHFTSKYGISILAQKSLAPGGKEMILTNKGGLGIVDPLEMTQSDYFMLILSKKEQRNFLLKQSDIDPKPSLNKLLYDLQVSRDLFEEVDDFPDDWFTKKMHIRIVRTEHAINAQGIQLAGDQLQVAGHETFQAKVSLESQDVPHLFPSTAQLFQDVFVEQGIDLVNFAQPGRSEKVNLIELSDIQSEESLRENPLQITLKPSEEAESSVLAVAFDGDHFLVVGDQETAEDGSTEILIDSVPDGAYDGRRSLGKALKMAFLKIALRRDEVHLRWANYSDPENPILEEDGLAYKVKESQRILLLIHGIIGNNEESAKSMALPVGEKGGSIKDAYDLVLSFTYENLNRPIEESAELLESSLTQVGLGPGHQKNLSILAHSMGGLVSRHMIERLNGRQIVQKLVMAGTPNLGSEMGNIADYQKMAVSVLNVALNFGKALLPFASYFQSALKHSDKLFVTLEQMKPDSRFMKELNNPNNSDPGVPYFIIGGDVRHFEPQEEGHFASLMTKIEKKVGGLFYKDEAHDIAVALPSIFGIPVARQPSPQCYELVCHHLNYYVWEDSLEVMAEILGVSHEEKVV